MGTLFAICSARRPPLSGTTIGGNVDVRVELFDDRALQHELSRLKAQYNGSVWMDSVLKPMRAAWDAGQQARRTRGTSAPRAR